MFGNQIDALFLFRMPKATFSESAIYIARILKCESTDPLNFEEMFADAFKPLAWVFSVHVNIERTVNVQCKIYPTVFELKEGKSIRLNCILYLINGLCEKTTRSIVSLHF